MYNKVIAENIREMLRRWRIPRRTQWIGRMPSE